MSFEAALASASAAGTDAKALGELARAALAEREEHRALPLLQQALRRTPDARLWQWKGLIERALDLHEQALASFAEAARMAPADAGIAHGHARVALEAGVDSEQLFERARGLAASNGEVVLGLMAARMAAGRGEQAEAELDALVGQAPLWLPGHVKLAQLRSLLGRSSDALTSLEQALEQRPSETSLWKTLFDLFISREQFEDLDSATARARQAGVGDTFLVPYAAVAAGELGRTELADQLFAKIPADGPLAIWRIRHLLRSARAAEALPLIDAQLRSEHAAVAWPYAALAWRLTNDERSNWLNNPRLVSVIDLGDELPPLERLAALLRSLHVSKGQYLDQSVRGGTQTDGPLFCRIEPEIKALRAAAVNAVDGYLARLPTADPGHPTLSARAHRRIRFSGSWSVLLPGGGFHTNHVHPQGWISSALYVVVPQHASDSPDDAGWLALGQPPARLRLDFAPTRLIEPRPGRLVLFPAWMWHGTRPFAEGERLTVAFDVAPP